jgi:hypothetical protein
MLTGRLAGDSEDPSPGSVRLRLGVYRSAVLGEGARYHITTVSDATVAAWQLPGSHCQWRSVVQIRALCALPLNVPHLAAAAASPVMCQ